MTLFLEKDGMGLEEREESWENKGWHSSQPVSDLPGTAREHAYFK